MLDVISGLSAVGAGILAPTAVRRALPEAKAAPGQAASEEAQDRFEPGPRHSREPGGDASAAAVRELTAEQEQEVEKLKERDREVRSHERAHKTAGGGCRDGPGGISARN